MTTNTLPNTDGNERKGSLSNVICGIAEVRYGPAADHEIKPSRSQGPLRSVMRVRDRDRRGAAGTALAPALPGAGHPVPAHGARPAPGELGADRERPDGDSGMDIARTASNPRRPTYVTLRKAAWLLGVPDSTVRRAIRVGTLQAVWRRSRLVVAERDLRQLMVPGGAA